ncbi:UDP-N-acetylglucosamine 2-epimerase, partial [Stenotrophomonas maltophilia]|uniref:UDP-N-acetylglucosamine 2-epimerase n=1 Tax=Stenotrophomonas maltophilia TaxID=40324 RepID=UPI0013DCAF6E
VVDHLSASLFCPTQAAVENLRREGIRDGIHAVGAVMYDATMFGRASARGRSTVISDLGLTPGGYDLATLHRAESTDDKARLTELAAW